MLSSYKLMGLRIKTVHRILHQFQSPFRSRLILCRYGGNQVHEQPKKDLGCQPPLINRESNHNHSPSPLIHTYLSLAILYCAL
jgi:hypothetical protein